MHSQSNYLYLCIYNVVSVRSPDLLSILTDNIYINFIHGDIVEFIREGS